MAETISIEQHAELIKKQNGKKRDNVEERLQVSISNFIRSKYPKVIFRGDLGGFRLPTFLAKLAKIIRCGRGMPDVDILEARGGHFGLFMELKKEKPFKLDGHLKKEKRYENPHKKIGEYDHLEEQAKMIVRLKKQGYLACFIWDLDQAMQVIDSYMSKPLTIEIVNGFKDELTKLKQNNG